MDGITDSTDMTLSKLWEIVKGREAWCAAVHRVLKSQTWLVVFKGGSAGEISPERPVFPAGGSHICRVHCLTGALP